MNAQQEDPLAMFDPVYGNEKPEAPTDDPLFMFSPESYQKQFKQPIQRYVNPGLEGTEDILPWYERGDRFSMESPIVSGTPEETLEAGKAAISGATAGFSEKIPGLNPSLPRKACKNTSSRLELGYCSFFCKKITSNQFFHR